MMRAAYAVETDASVTAGKTRCAKSGGEPMPDIGRKIEPPVHSFSLMPKNTWNIMPSQKTGTDTRIDVDSVTRMSKNEYCLMADMMPAPMPITISSTMAASARRIVLGYLSANISTTGRSF